MKIAVVGAGIGGLTFAVALQRKLPSIQIELLERDKTYDARSQGYALSLRKDMGLKVLDDLGLAYEPRGTNTKSFVITTSGGWTLMNMQPVGKKSPFYTYQFLRPDLRELLMSALGSNTRITYDAPVTRYENLATGGCRVWLVNNTTLDADVVVVADGSKSKLRKQFTKLSADPTLGIGMIVGQVEQGFIPTQRLNLEATLFMLGQGESMFLVSSTEATAAWSLGLHVTDELRKMTPEQLHAHATAVVSNWADPAPSVVRSTAPEGLRLTEILDVTPLSTAVDGNVIFIGDACHPMTPYQGRGANSAMLDALDVANFLSSHISSMTSSAVPGARWDSIALQELGERIAQRGAANVLASRNAALTFHERSWHWSLLRNAHYWSLGWLMALMPKG